MDANSSVTSRARNLPVCVTVGIVALGFVLSGCASSGPQVGEPHARYRLGHPSYRVEPYQVKGVWYTPKVDYNYDETGTASWYGPGFDRQPTADGEIYDMNQVSAAHKTLPLPSVVEVTNLQNGRALRVRVNDRGPFVDGRLIDMSRRSAQLLGFEGSGTAPVRVRIIKDESIRVAEAAMRGELGGVALAQAAPSYVATPGARTAPPAARPIEAQPATQVAAAGPPSLRAAQVIGEPLPAPMPSPVAAPSPAASPEPAPAYPTAVAAAPRRYWPSLIGQAHAEPLHPQIASLATPAPRPVAAPTRNSGRIFVQAGAFAVPENAQRVRARVAALGSVEIVPTSGGGLYRVRVGPVASEAAAARLLSKVVDSGYPGARVVSE
jgi:rare lipoprotein A